MAILSTIAGCGGSRGGNPRTAADVRDLTSRVQEGRFLDTGSGERVDFAHMMDDLAEVRVVYVGEHHDEPADHALQLAIVQALYARDPSLAVGMEMVRRPHQDALDAWVAGRIDRAELRERTGWDESKGWGFDFGLYAPIFETARERDLPLVALNAPWEWTHIVAHGGLDALEPEQREALPELDLEVERHRALVEEALTAHHEMEPEMLEGFYTAQVIWDETMGQSVARFLERPEAPRRMVVLAGRMHVREGLGIPDRAARRGAEPYRVVLSIPEDELSSLEGPPPADWLWLR